VQKVDPTARIYAHRGDALGDGVDDHLCLTVRHLRKGGVVDHRSWAQYDQLVDSAVLIGHIPAFDALRVICAGMTIRVAFDMSRTDPIGCPVPTQIR
jgi:hypothetical protein